MQQAESTLPKGGSVYIETYGCQMNEYDSGVIGGILKKNNFIKAMDPSTADLILINTCAVRENAHAKIYNRLDALGHFKKKNPEMLIGLVGCMAQNLGEDLLHMDLPLDMVVGPDNYRNLPEMIDLARKKNQKISHTMLSRTETYEGIEPLVENPVSAFVTIMRGCNNFCTFCVVPYTRGRERSREAKEILEEVLRLEQIGIKQITLLGQNVNSYKTDLDDFTSLVKLLLEKSKIPRIRFTSPHPKDFPDSMLSLMKSEERFSPSIHLPLQSGSDTILASMKRSYTQEEYIQIAEKIRSTVDNPGLTTDIIVGFPGETDEDFEKTLDVVRKIRFDSAFMFKYSAREGTVASRTMEDDVPEEVKSRRLTQLVEIQTSISHEENQKRIGNVYEVLTEDRSKKSDQELMGRTPCGRTVIFPNPTGEEYENAIGQFFQVRIDSASSATLKGVSVSG